MRRMVASPPNLSINLLATLRSGPDSVMRQF
jgi:hypothetical protein